MSDLSKRRPQIDFCAGYRAHKRGEPREGCSKAWHEGWDAHAELASLRDYNLELQSLDSIQQMAIEKLIAERDALRELLKEARNLFNCVSTFQQRINMVARIDAALKR